MGEAGRAKQIFCAADFVEGGEPTAEGGGVVLPAGASGGAGGSLRRVGAKEAVRLHGECGQAMEWAGKNGCG